MLEDIRKRMEESMLTTLFGNSQCIVNVDDLKQTLSLIDKYQDAFREIKACNSLVHKDVVKMDRSAYGGSHTTITLMRIDEISSAINRVLEKE